MRALSAFSTPTALRPLAQGCEARATLGHRPQIISNRNAVAAIPARPSRATFATTALRLIICSTMTQGRRSRANLGLEADAPLGHSNRGARVRADGHNPFGIEHRFATPIHAGEPLPIWHPSHMPQSLSAVHIHLVFSTKDRRPLLRDKPTRDALHSYLGGVSKPLDCPPILVGGVEDHVHLLAP